VAITKLGAIFSGLRGSAGGTVFSAGKAGTYAHSFYRPSRNATHLRNQQRSRFSGIKCSWEALTQIQRNGWDAYGAGRAKTNSLGDIFFASGYNWFATCNLRLLTQGDAPVVNCPINPPPGPLLTLTLTYNFFPNVASIAYTANPVGAGLRVVVFGTTTFGDGRSVATGSQKFIAASPVNQASPYDFTAEWEAAEGNILDGHHGWITVFVSDAQGTRSAPLTDDSPAT